MSVLGRLAELSLTDRASSHPGAEPGIGPLLPTLPCWGVFGARPAGEVPGPPGEPVSGLGTSREGPGRAGQNGQGEGSLGFLRLLPLHPNPGKQKMVGWMGGWVWVGHPQLLSAFSQKWH